MSLAHPTETQRPRRRRVASTIGRRRRCRSLVVVIALIALVGPPLLSLRGGVRADDASDAKRASDGAKLTNEAVQDKFADLEKKVKPVKADFASVEPFAAAADEPSTKVCECGRDETSEFASNAFVKY